MLLDAWRDAAAIVEQGVEVGAREHLAQHFEALLAAAHSRQPIVHQGDARLLEPERCRRTPAVHGMAPTPRALNSRCTAPRISASAASVVASKRSTRIGCVFDARTRAQPSGKRMRTPSTSIVG